MIRWLLGVILLVAEGSSAIQQITFGSNIDHTPAWSPDGTRIAFARIVGYADNADIYVVSVDGSWGTTRITFNPSEDLTPAWSPDGNNIAFLSDRYPTGVWVHNLSSMSEISLVENSSSFCWSPDGKFIAYSKTIDGDIEIYKKEMQTGIETRLTFSPGQDAFPDWSPDGKLIIYEHGDYNPGIFIIPAAGGTPVQVPIPYGYDISWSPDSKKICFDAGALTSISIYIYDFTTGVLTNTHVTGMETDWSPDGKKIVYTGPWGHLFIMDYPLILEHSTLGRIKALYR
jgi:TolB protein